MIWLHYFAVSFAISFGVNSGAMAAWLLFGILCKWLGPAKWDVYRE